MQTPDLFDIFSALKKPLALFLLLALVSACACTTQKTGTTGNVGSGIGTAGGGVYIGGHGNGGSGSGGGIDPGGGKFINSSRDEVIKIVNGVWEELTSSGSGNPVLVAYLKLKNTENKSSEQTHILEMLNKILWNNEKAPDSFLLNSKGEFPETRLKELKTKRPQFEENKLCNEGEDDSMMSVTRFDFSGDICVNLKGMMASSTSSSKFDVMALLVHELGHLAGYQHVSGDESQDDLKRIQRFFLKNAAILYRMDGLTAKGNYANEVSYLARIWYYSALTFDSPIDVEYIGGLKHAKEYYDRLIIQLPDPVLNAELHVAQPDLYANAKQKLEDVLDKTIDFTLHWYGCECDHTATKASQPLANLNNKPQPWNEKFLNDLRQILLARLDAEQAVNEYFFGNAIPTKKRTSCQ